MQLQALHIDCDVPPPNTPHYAAMQALVGNYYIYSALTEAAMRSGNDGFIAQLNNMLDIEDLPSLPVIRATSFGIHDLRSRGNSNDGVTDRDPDLRRLAHYSLYRNIVELSAAPSPALACADDATYALLLLPESRDHAIKLDVVHNVLPLNFYNALLWPIRLAHLRPLENAEWRSWARRLDKLPPCDVWRKFLLLFFACYKHQPFGDLCDELHKRAISYVAKLPDMRTWCQPHYRVVDMPTPALAQYYVGSLGM